MLAQQSTYKPQCSGITSNGELFWMTVNYPTILLWTNEPNAPAHRATKVAEREIEIGEDPQTAMNNWKTELYS